MKPQHKLYGKIIAVIATLAVLPAAGFAYFGPDGWYENLQNWQSGLGAYWGILGGLGAILGGALFNAGLTRDRDDWLHKRESRELADALLGEITAAYITCAAFVSSVEEQAAKKYTEDWLKSPVRGGHFAPHVTTTVFDANAAKIGMLGTQLTKEIVTTFSFFFDFARIAKKQQDITYGELISDRVGMAKVVKLRLIDFSETIEILEAYIAGGYEAAVPIGIRVEAARQERLKKMAKELGLPGD